MRNNYFDTKSMKDLSTNENLNEVLGFVHLLVFIKNI
jgi:hypothetical protein